MRQNKNIRLLTYRDVINSYIKYFLVLIFNFFSSNILFIFLQSIKYSFKFPNLKNPRFVYEKLIFMKLFYKNPLLTICANKLTLNKYLDLVIDKKITNPVIKVFYTINQFNKFDFDKLDYPIIIKSTNSSGGSIIVFTHNDLITKKQILTRYANFVFFRKYYYYGREWAYKNSNNQLIIEKFLGNINTESIDYKFYVYGGKTRYFMVSLGELNGNVRNHKFDPDLKSIDHLFKSKATLSLNSIKLSSSVREMIEISNLLGSPFPHVRIDFIENNKGFFLNEMTFYSSSGFLKIQDRKLDLELANSINFDKEYIKGNL